MKNKTKTISRALRLLLCLYLAFALLANTLPFAWPVEVGGESEKRLEQSAFTSEGVGVDRVALLENPVEALGARLEMLQAAEDSVDIAYHFVQSGSSTDAVLAEVLAAADRGVQVRILLDGTAGLADPRSHRTMEALAGHPGIEYKRYAPVRPLRPWEWQAVLHDKFIAVDSRWLILGGRNLGDRFYGPAGYSGHITNDRDVLVWRTGAMEPGDGSVLHQARDYMDLLWNSEYVAQLAPGKATGALEDVREALIATEKEFERQNPAFYQMSLEDYQGNTAPTNRITLLHNPIHTGKKEPWVAWQMRRLALEAEESVWIQTPYATANAGLLRTLAEVNGNVPKVVMVTNSVASSPNYPAFSNYLVNRGRFANTGTQIYEYQSRDSIHGKSMVVDNRLSVVGSLNLDDRSIYIDTETMLVIDSAEFAPILLEAMGELREQSLLVEENGRGYAQDQSVEPLPAGLGKRFVMAAVSRFSRFFQFLI